MYLLLGALQPLLQALVPLAVVSMLVVALVYVTVRYDDCGLPLLPAALAAGAIGTVAAVLWRFPPPLPAAGVGARTLPPAAHGVLVLTLLVAGITGCMWARGFADRRKDRRW